MSLKRVLIVDDAMELGRLYQESLRTAYPGVPVTFVPSAEEALLEASRYTFDLMITDIRLPGMSGLDLVKKIRIKQTAIKSIVITGLRIDEALQKQFDAVHAQKLLHKPLSVTEFLNAVEEVIGVEQAPLPVKAPELIPERAPERASWRMPESRRGGKEPESTREKTSPLGKPAVTSVATVPVPAVSPVRVPEVEKSAAVLPLLGEALANLRGSSGALAVIVLDDLGRTAASAGDWPRPELAEKLPPVLMAALNASDKVARQLDAGMPAAEAAGTVFGRDFNLVYAPVGTHALLIFVKNEPGALRMALAFEEVLHAQKLLADVLTGMGINLQPGGAVKTEPAVADEKLAHTPAGVTADVVEARVETPEDLVNLHALEAILGKPMAGSQVVNADSFWDDLTQAASRSTDNPDALTYEQARKLGLLPDEEK